LIRHPAQETATRRDLTGPVRPGLLVSIEGISGVGKSYLTTLLRQHPALTPPPLVIDEFSRRAQKGSDLGRDLLRVLIDNARGDPFLRGGAPRSETLFLLAIKMYDYESSRPALRDGQVVIEGRSLHTVAVYQSLILHPHDDDAAFTEAQTILDQAARWRPLPDLTVLITDDVSTALHRAEQRDTATISGANRDLHTRAAALFDRLAECDPIRIKRLDRRHRSPTDAIDYIVELMKEHRRAAPDQTSVH
jgi:dTMP kinase